VGLHNGVLEGRGKAQAEKVEELRVEWERLWRERFDDRVRAEGVANQDYSSLFVERGTVIFATRNFRPLTFRGILEEHGDLLELVRWRWHRVTYRFAVCF
jgi:hypothetical protein